MKFLAWILFLLFSAEILFRFFAPLGDFTALSSRWQQPYLHFGDFKSSGSPESPESYGYESKFFAYSYDGLNNTERGNFFKEIKSGFQGLPVYLVGGSAALGDGASSDPGRLSNQLTNLLQPKYYIETRAGRAYQSTQERLMFDMYLQDTKPAKYIFFDGYNDMNQLESAARPGDPYNMGVYYSIHESKAFRFMYAFSGVSNLARYLTKNWYERLISKATSELYNSPVKLDNYNKSIAEIYWKNISSIHKQCKAFKYQCYFIIQPALGEINSSTNRFFWSAYSEVKKNQPEEMNPVILDLVEKYKNRAELFVDPVHMTDQGQGLVAKDIIDFIQE